MGRQRGKGIPLAERFWPKVNKTDTCWLWTGSLNNRGYGMVWDIRTQKPMLAHRASYELLVGDIPRGLTLDHLCSTPECVNPAHLEPVTHAENIRRGRSAGAVAVRTGRCRHGHDEWHYRPNGTRYCYACRRIRRRHTSSSGSRLGSSMGKATGGSDPC